MKDLVVLKNDKWYWPKFDESSWKYQNEYNDLIDHILPYLKNKRIMVQAGGNCGYLLNTFVDHFETIYTFEPDPVNFYCLNNNVNSEKVIKMQCCLGNDGLPVSTQQLIREDRPNDTGGVHISGVGSTPSIIIDNLNLQGCDLIQLDIEGYEYKALLGCLETIIKYKPVLCIEFCEKWLNRYDDNSQKILDLLESLDYYNVETHGVDKIFISK